jgi:Amidohydrolase family
MTKRLPLCSLAVLPVLTIVAASSTLPAQAPASATTVVIRNVNVIPMDSERVLSNQTIVIRGDRIAELGPLGQVKAPGAAIEVDGTGRFLIPALAEMHAHVPGGQAPDSAVNRVLFLYAANGIGTIRGMLGDPRHLVLRDRLAKGELWGPLLRTSGPSFNGNSVPTPAAAIAAVTEQKQLGYDLLKIHPGVKLDVFDALAATADKVGIRFAGHVPLDVGLARALESRYWTLDHIDGFVEALAKPGAPPSQMFGANLMAHLDESRIPGLVESTKKAGTWIVPTSILLENWLGETPPDEMTRWPEMKYADPAQVAQWVETKKKMTSQVPAADRQRFLALRRRLLKALHDGGAGILLGSDAPQIWNVPGFSAHRELQLMVASGLTPYQSLSTGTRNVAAHFGTLADAGTITVGKRADLVLLDGNPLVDISNTAKIAGVALGGRWRSGDILKKGLDSAP